MVDDLPPLSLNRVNTASVGGMNTERANGFLQVGNDNTSTNTNHGFTPVTQIVEPTLPKKKKFQAIFIRNVHFHNTFLKKIDFFFVLTEYFSSIKIEKK